MRFPRHELPPMAFIRQHLPSPSIADPRRHVCEALLAAGIAKRLAPGASVAITAGSRGMGGFVPILAGIVDAVKAAKGDPFLIPAMGSHGGATAEGQTEILRRLGVDQAGAPVRATMETRIAGRAPDGATAHIDRLAAEADAVIVLGRVKTHPESAGELASGLLKMCTVGLGKQAGAHEAHCHGLWPSVTHVPKQQMQAAHILYGVAVVENGLREPLAIEIVPGNYDAFLEADMRLLRLAKEHLATIPFRELDLLIVDEIGKNISGAGMDPNVIGHWRISGGPRIPDFRRIAALSLTEPSLGNGLGIGLADFTTERFQAAFDPAVTYINAVTASEPGSQTIEAKLPLALPSDREAVELALYSSLPGESPKVCRIQNTAALETMWVSEALLGEVEQSARLSVVQPAEPVRFNAEGNLI